MEKRGSGTIIELINSTRPNERKSCQIIWPFNQLFID